VLFSVSLALRALASAPWVVAPALAYVEVREGDKVLARRGRVVVPVLESPQSLPPTLASVVRAAGR
jgi:hypothetical protein